MATDVAGKRLELSLVGGGVVSLAGGAHHDGLWQRERTQSVMPLSPAGTCFVTFVMDWLARSSLTTETDHERLADAIR